MSDPIIARGPMADDHYARIHNLIVRGAIPTRYVGVYGYVASHNDGWRLSVARLAKTLGVGRDFITSALKAIESAGLMIREQERNADGTLGGAVWFITDVPMQLRSLGMTDKDLIAASTRAAYDQWRQQNEMPSSQPSPANPSPVTTSENESLPSSQPLPGFPSPVQPATANPHTKKNLGLEDLPFVEEPPSSVGSSRASGDQAPTEEEESRTEDQTRAVDMVVSLPAVGRTRINGMLRRELVELITTHLAGGWSPEDIRAELTRDLDGARGPGVYRSRLLDLPVVAPRKTKPAPTKSRRRAVEEHPFTGTGRDCTTCGGLRTSAMHL